MTHELDTTPSADNRELYTRKNPSSDYGVRGQLAGAHVTTPQTTEVKDPSDTTPEQLSLDFLKDDGDGGVASGNYEVAPPSEIFKAAKEALRVKSARYKYRVSAQTAGRIAASSFLNNRL